MKFQFCGNLNAPEWFLAESAILSKIASLKLRLIVGHIFKHLIEDIDNSEKIYPMLENSGFNHDEINSILASLDFIINNSVRYEVADTTLLKELIDLGLPKENCESIIKIYRENADKLREKKQKSILRIGSLKSFKYSINEVIASKNFNGLLTKDTTHVEMKMKVSQKESKNHEEEVKFIMAKDKVLDIFTELKKARDIMDRF